MKGVGTRRQLLRAAVVWVAFRSLRAARKAFWNMDDPARWSSEEKQILLGDSPWAREGFARMDEQKGPRPGEAPPAPLPDTRPGVPPGGIPTTTIGERVPPAPKPGGRPVQFAVLARWETAKPVRLAGGPEIPELAEQFYVIRLRGLPLMPPPKAKPGAAPGPDPNEDMLKAIKMGTQLDRVGKASIRCDHLFTGSGNASSDVLMFFPRTTDPITITDKVVTLESRFAVFHLSIRFALKDMMYKGELAL
jgi:hypothetical protein